ncbi:hypothetical protein KAX35_07965, partial [candidate division WOR-3 bacterium]|nr:hypothetical protein [candidate division WOR-3 bacterium]
MVRRINYIWLIVISVITPMCLYGVNEGYSVITESSPWGFVTEDDIHENYGNPSNWDDIFEPRLDSMQSCGLSWVRPNCGPGLKIYPGPDYDFEGQDSMQVYIHRRGMNWLRLGWPPDWMKDSVKWWDYWQTVVERYDGDGEGHGVYTECSTLIRPCKYWEIINEPYSYSMRPKCSGPTPDSVRTYLRIWGKAIHYADSGINGAKVVAPTLGDGRDRWELPFVYPDDEDTLYWIGDTIIIDNDTFVVDFWDGYDFHGYPCKVIFIEGENNAQWLSYLLRDSVAEQIDVVSHHTYWGDNPLDFENLENDIRDTLNAYGLGDKPIWITEVGWTTRYFRKRGDGGSWIGVSDTTQASYYKQLVQEVLDKEWLNKVFFFADRDCGRVTDTTAAKYGITWYDYQHKFTFDTIKTFINTQTPDIQLTSPTGGEDWACDSVCNITWIASDIQTSDNALTINIAYSTDSGKTWIAVTEMEENDSTYQWTIPNTPSDSCRVRIRARDSDYLEGQYISGIFAISDRTPPSVSLLTPEGGEIWEIGGLKKIEWTEPTDNVEVDIVKVLFTSNYPGGQWDTIACVSPETTYYHWEIPDSTSLTCRIKVIAFDEALNSCEDMCDAN